MKDKKRRSALAAAIVEWTDDYERWLAAQLPFVVREDLDKKHADMCESPFVFLRATYYAWAKLWPIALPELAKAPAVMAIGDLHIENFGTWRDAEGRLAWGVNDFDEASELAYTNDLVRLAASASLAYEKSRIRTPARKLCAALLKGYRKRLEKGRRPTLLAERHQRLGERVVRDLVQPRAFWEDKMAEGETAPPTPPRDAPGELHRALPDATAGVRVWARQAGVGSLGRPRFAAVGAWHGGKVAREAKARAPSASVWAGGSTSAGDGAVELLLANSGRSPDPFLSVSRGWIVRRLAPDSDKIRIDTLPPRLERELAMLMGDAVANVHLATPGADVRILRHLDEREPGWLVDAARLMARLTERAHRVWVRHADAAGSDAG
jgi:hypothetical protein